MYTLQERITPTRLAYLRTMEKVGTGEADAPRGGARSASLKFGWVQGVYRMPDGRMLTATEFETEVPLSRPNRWDGVKFAGLRLTDKGREVLRANNG